MGEIPLKGRLLGVDFGSVRLGLAVGDPASGVASSLMAWRRQNRSREADFFRKVIQDQHVTRIVVGLPVHMSGQEGAKAQAARAFGSWLAQTTEMPVVYWDERLSTVEAEGYLQGAGLTRKKRQSRRDQLAAQIILQSYMDAGCPDNPVPGPLEEARD